MVHGDSNLNWLLEFIFKCYGFSPLGENTKILICPASVLWLEHTESGVPFADVSDQTEGVLNFKFTSTRTVK